MCLNHNLIPGGSHNLPAGSVVSHILSILDDPFMCAAFGLDHSSILLKDILRVRAYWQHIGQKHWQGEQFIVQGSAALGKP